jgi:Putative beta-barrel porin-2, OmpL-like. bbp2
LLPATLLFAQNDTLKKLTFSAYAEIYYSYDFANPSNHEKSNFIYNHKRHNEISANLLLAKANYTDNNIRANLGVMAGNYPQYNLSAEPTWAQFV